RTHLVLFRRRIAGTVPHIRHHVSPHRGSPMRRLRYVLLLAFLVAVPLAIVMAIPKTRVLALAVIRQENHNGDRFAGEWARMLDDSNENVRKEAAYQLGQMGESSKRYVPDLAKAL